MKKLFENVNGHQFKLNSKCLKESVDYYLLGDPNHQATLRSSVASLIIGDEPGVIIDLRKVNKPDGIDPVLVKQSIDSVLRRMGKTAQDLKHEASKPYPSSQDEDVKRYNMVLNKIGHWLSPKDIIKYVLPIPTYFHEFAVELTEMYSLAEAGIAQNKLIVDDPYPED